MAVLTPRVSHLIGAGVAGSARIPLVNKPARRILSHLRRVLRCTADRDGVEFQTDVRQIDILATCNGDFHALGLNLGRSPQATLSHILRYMGWVKSTWRAPGGSGGSYFPVQHPSSRLTA